MIIGGLGLLHIGDGDQTDLEPLFRLLQLARDCLLGALFGIQKILRREHVEIALGDPNQQVLLGRFKIGAGLGGALVGLPQAHELIPAEHGLAQLQTPLGDAIEILFEVANGRDCAGNVGGRARRTCQHDLGDGVAA